MSLSPLPSRESQASVKKQHHSKKSPSSSASPVLHILDRYILALILYDSSQKSPTNIVLLKQDFAEETQQY